MHNSEISYKIKLNKKVLPFLKTFGLNMWLRLQLTKNIYWQRLNKEKMFVFSTHNVKDEVLSLTLMVLLIKFFY